MPPGHPGAAPTSPARAIGGAGPAAELRGTGGAGWRGAERNCGTLGTLWGAVARGPRLPGSSVRARARLTARGGRGSAARPPGGPGRGLVASGVADPGSSGWGGPARLGWAALLAVCGPGRARGAGEQRAERLRRQGVSAPNRERGRGQRRRGEGRAGRAGGRARAAPSAREQGRPGRGPHSPDGRDRDERARARRPAASQALIPLRQAFLGRQVLPGLGVTIADDPLDTC